jgi:hypothetical protein
MTTRSALRQGFMLARRSQPAVWILLVVNLLLAVLAAYPIYSGVLRFTSRSLLSQALAFGFSRDWLQDYAVNSVGSLHRYSEFILLFGLIAIPVNSVLAGGALARFQSPQLSYTTGDFFRNCSRYGWRLLRLALIGLILYWFVFWLLNQAIGGVLDRWTRDWLDDRPVFWVKLAQYAVLLLELAFVNLVMDFARVRLVLDDKRSAIASFLGSLGFSLGCLPQAAAVYAIPSLFGLAVAGLYLLLASWITPLGHPGVPRGYVTGALAVVLLFLVQQVVMFFRYGFRIAAWGSEWSLVEQAERPQ